MRTIRDESDHLMKLWGWGRIAESMHSLRNSTAMDREKWLLGGILLLGLVHGLIFIFLVPPWQHYEEPTHFEYAWLIGTRHTLPKSGTFDQDIRRKIASSMIEHKFFRGMSFLPNLDSRDEPIWIGISVVGGPPLYNILVSLPLTVISGWDIDVQLYAARLVSLALYVLTIALAYCIVGELVPQALGLRWMVPLVLAMLPGFVDLMTAVNNTVGAVFIFSLFLWVALRLVVRGLTARRLALTLGAAALCVWTKDIVLLAVPLSFVAILLSLFRNHLRLAVSVLSLAALILALLVFSWGDAALWYRETQQEIATRACFIKAPVGNCALVLQSTPRSGLAQTEQIMTLADAAALRGKTVTIGAWIWADRPTSASLPILSDTQLLTTRFVQAAPDPSFYAVRGQVAENASRPHLILQVGSDPIGQTPLSLYYDGIVIVEGAWPLDTAPVFDDGTAEAGTWGGRRFINRVRNASAETGWLGIRPWAESFARFAGERHLSPTVFMASLLDPQNLDMLYPTAKTLFKTFWGLFGWAHIPMSPGWYTALFVLSLLGIAGGTVALLKDYNRQPHSVKLGIVFQGIAVWLLWSIVFLRGFFSVLDGTGFVPVARYAYPVIIPTVLFLCVGWMQLLGKPQGAKVLIPLVAFFALDLNSIVTIVNYFK